ncbi:hypothetical protein [Microbulbifer sp. TYP-18]|uniref:hypothetical protein n=1 Tax=Microbulbifer sp. TYP-18 TaxID=3230024 RepID=UPI0034C6D601
MEPVTGAAGLSPVAAVLTIFALIFTAIGWLRLLRTSFHQNLLQGWLAIFTPPLALLLLAPHWRREKELFALALGALGFFSIAAFL